MSNFWKIKKKSYWDTAIVLQKRLPWLKNVSVTDIEDHLRGTQLGFVEEKSTPRPYWVRLSLPFALILMLILYVTLPIKFMITGTWNYKWNWLSNWFKAIGF